MRQNHIISLSQKGFSTVAIVFEMTNEPKKAWTYKAPNSLELTVGDLVVVQANTSFKVGKVAEVHAEPQIDTDSDIDYKWVIDKVDLTLFNKIQENEEAFLAQLKKMQKQSVANQITATLAEQFGGTPEEVGKAVDSFLDVNTIAGISAGNQLTDQTQK